MTRRDSDPAKGLGCILIAAVLLWGFAAYGLWKAAVEVYHGIKL